MTDELPETKIAELALVTVLFAGLRVAVYHETTYTASTEFPPF